jgi:hypothetical protein
LLNKRLFKHCSLLDDGGLLGDVKRHVSRADRHAVLDSGAWWIAAHADELLVNISAEIEQQKIGVQELEPDETHRHLLDLRPRRSKPRSKKRQASAKTNKLNGATRRKPKRKRSSWASKKKWKPTKRSKVGICRRICLIFIVSVSRLCICIVGDKEEASAIKGTRTARSRP